jgi:membrane-associated phospholipid phosphatase
MGAFRSLRTVFISINGGHNDCMSARGTPSFARTIALTAAIGYAIVSVVLLGLGLLLTHVLLHGALGRWDNDSSRWLAAHRVSWLNDVTAVFSWLADTIGIVIVAAVTEVVLFLRRHRREALLLLVGLPVELAGFLTVNTLVDRPRPAVHRLGSLPSTSSFPSGHTAAALVLYGLIALIVSRIARSPVAHRIAWTFAILMPLLVGFSRVYRGMHHVTDAVAGVLLGLGSLVTARAAVLPASVGEQASDASGVPIVEGNEPTFGLSERSV